MTLPHDEETDLGELPPLDDDAHAPPLPAESAEDDAPVEGEASLDDATGEDDPVDPGDLDVDESEAGWVGEAADAAGVDLGDADIDDLGAEESAAADAEEPGVGDEDFGFGDAPERGGLDGGDEGPLDADEELRAEDLPALDADDEGDVDEASLVEVSFSAEELLGLPWAAAPWDRVGAPLAVESAVAVACAGPFALVAGRGEGGAPELLRVDLEGAAQPLLAEGLAIAEVRALASRGLSVVAATDAGVFVSDDAGATFVPADAAAIDVALLAAQVAEPDASGAVDASMPPVGARRSSVRAVAARRGGVLRDLGDGTWRAHSWPGRVMAVALLDDAGTLVAATYTEADDSSTLVRLDVDGKAAVVARVGATRSDPESDGRVRAMALDEARGVVWAVGGFGVVAFSVGA